MRINKEKTYIMIGTVLIQCGACMIHFGLGIILLGAWFLIGSYFEFEKSIDDDDIKDLNEAAKHYLYNNILYDDVYVGNPTDEDCIEMFKAGANWQKQKDNNNANHALVEQIKTQQMCYEKGMADMKQQIMKNSLYGEVTYGKSLAIPSLGYFLDNHKLDFGDKVKVIIIKEE